MNYVFAIARSYGALVIILHQQCIPFFNKCSFFKHESSFILFLTRVLKFIFCNCRIKPKTCQIMTHICIHATQVIWMNIINKVVWISHYIPSKRCPMAHQLDVVDDMHTYRPYNLLPILSWCRSIHKKQEKN